MGRQGGAGAPATSDQLPRVTTRVEVTVDGTAQLSTVQDNGPGGLLIAAIPGRVHVGQAVKVRWASGGGCHEVSCSIAAVTEVPLRSWSLTPIGPVSSEQRREVFRVPISTPMAFRLAPDDERPAVLVDLSEGGLLARVQNPPEPGTHVTAVVELRGEPLELSGTVLRHGATDVDGRTHAAVEFHPLNPVTARTLRRELLAAQIEARRMAVDAR